MMSHLQCLIVRPHVMGEEVGKLRKLEIISCSFCDLQEFEKYAKSIQGKWPTNLYLEVGSSEATDLKICLIKECKGLECVVDLSLSPCNTLDDINKLFLESLWNLHELVRVGVALEFGSTSPPPTPPAIFSSLK
ncbi:hypothetical protein QUC31_001952 [Theobroma cacao]